MPLSDFKVGDKLRGYGAGWDGSTVTGVASQHLYTSHHSMGDGVFTAGMLGRCYPEGHPHWDHKQPAQAPKTGKLLKPGTQLYRVWLTLALHRASPLTGAAIARRAGNISESGATARVRELRGLGYEVRTERRKDEAGKVHYVYQLVLE